MPPYSKAAFLSIVIVAMSADPLSAQALDPFLGVWEGRGRLFNMDAGFHMTWERVLGGRFVRLTFRNSIPGTDGSSRSLDAQAYYKLDDDGRINGTWFDSRGMVLPLRGSVEGDALIIHWGSPETEEGRTEYRFVDETRIIVEDFVLRDGDWHHFGHAAYERANAR